MVSKEAIFWVPIQVNLIHRFAVIIALMTFTEMLLITLHCHPIIFLKKKKTGSVRKTQHWGSFAEPFLPWKRKSITFSECVPVALVFQYAHSMRRVTSSSVAWLALPYFTTLSYKRHELRNKIYWIQNLCFDILYIFCLKYLSFEDELREILS
jgi:hypothetical protein